MKCSHIKEILKDAESQIRELDDQIVKAKQKLQMLKNRKSILYFKLTNMRRAIVDVQLRKHVLNMKQSKEVEKDLSQMLGTMLSLENGIRFKAFAKPKRLQTGRISLIKKSLNITPVTPQVIPPESAYKNTDFRSV